MDRGAGSEECASQHGWSLLDADDNNISPSKSAPYEPPLTPRVSAALPPIPSSPPIPASPAHYRTGYQAETCTDSPMALSPLLSPLSHVSQRSLTQGPVVPFTSPTALSGGSPSESVRVRGQSMLGSSCAPFEGGRGREAPESPRCGSSKRAMTFCTPPDVDEGGGRGGREGDGGGGGGGRGGGRGRIAGGDEDLGGDGGEDDCGRGNGSAEESRDGDASMEKRESCHDAMMSMESGISLSTSVFAADTSGGAEGVHGDGGWGGFRAGVQLIIPTDLQADVRVLQDLEVLPSDHRNASLIPTDLEADLREAQDPQAGSVSELDACSREVEGRTTCSLLPQSPASARETSAAVAAAAAAAAWECGEEAGEEGEAGTAREGKDVLGSNDMLESGPEVQSSVAQTQSAEPSTQHGQTALEPQMFLPDKDSSSPIPPRLAIPPLPLSADSRTSCPSLSTESCDGSLSSSPQRNVKAERGTSRAEYTHYIPHACEAQSESRSVCTMCLLSAVNIEHAYCSAFLY